MMSNNLFNNIPDLTESEEFETLLQQDNIKIERIISSPQPEETLQRQKHDEWVLLLEGEAVLDIENKNHPLASGDYLFIPAGTPHRVVSTSREPLCIWLAIHIYPSES
jgi:cupin 2 domain-containing protein